MGGWMKAQRSTEQICHQKTLTREEQEPRGIQPEQNKDEVSCHELSDAANLILQGAKGQKLC